MSDAGQLNKVLTKVLCHNMCVLIRAAHNLGVEPNCGAGSGVEPKRTLFGFVFTEFWRIALEHP